MKEEKAAGKLIKWLLAIAAAALAVITFVKTPNAGSLMLLLAAILIMPIKFNKELWGTNATKEPADFSRAVFRVFIILLLFIFGFIGISDANALKAKDAKIEELEKRCEAIEAKYDELSTSAPASESDIIISSSDAESSEPCNYVLNVKTGKFHYDWCESVGQIKEKNKEEITATREEMISQGYEPCGECRP